MIKSNDMVVSALAKLDMAIKRGTSSLTKSIATATSKMTEAVNTTAELVKKNQPIGDSSGSSGGLGGGGLGGSTKSIGLIAALIGGAGMAALIGSHAAEASINTNDRIEPENNDDPIVPKLDEKETPKSPAKPDGERETLPSEDIDTPNLNEEDRDTSLKPEDNVFQSKPSSEAKLRKEGAPKPVEQTHDIEIKVKELTFEADDIIFEADEFKFTNKSGASSSGSNAPSSPVTNGVPPETQQQSGATLGSFIGGGGGAAVDAMGNVTGADASPVGGGSPTSAPPSGGEGPDIGGGDGPGGTGPGVSKVGGASPTQKESRIGGTKVQQAMAAAKEQLREEGVPEANLDAAASHLVGQALSESGLNPTLSHDQGTGYGVYGARLERRTKMLDWLKQNGHSPDSLVGQMKEMAHQAMSNSYKPTRDALMGATKDNFNDVAKTITHNFESPRFENWQDRAANAQKAYNTPTPAKSQTASLNPEVPKDIDRNPAIKITPDAWKQGTSPVSPWTKDKNLESMDGSDVIDARKSLEQQQPNIDTGAKLNGAQKEQDDRENNPSFNERFNAVVPDKRSDASDGGSDSFQTSILETQGPNHFADFPMSDQGVGA